MKVAMIGTRGVPARYGGFETCVEEVGARLADRGHVVTVYCRGEQDRALSTYRGMHLVHRPALRRRTLETLSHTAAPVAHVLRHRVDAAIVFNAANAPMLPALRRAGIPVATHVDGLEWQRAKWGPNGRRYYRSMESFAVRWSDALIADAAGIADYYRDEFDAPTDLITYGAPVLGARNPELLRPLGLDEHGYHLVVARFEPENNVELVVQGYAASSATRPLVVVGSAPYADAYTRRVHAAGDDRVRFLGGVWDQALLDQLYANALTYLHGHSVGGTNPSLLRAVGAATATNAYDVSFNREVLGMVGRYFSTAADVTALVGEAEAEPEEAVLRGGHTQLRAEDYCWDDVALRYEALCRRLVEQGPTSERPDGRRRSTSSPVLAPVAEPLGAVQLPDATVEVVAAPAGPEEDMDAPVRRRASA